MYYIGGGAFVDVCGTLTNLKVEDIMFKLVRSSY